jgi:hypothetical protein
MALSYEFRQALKHRSRRSRRIQVLLFFAFVAVGLSYAGQPWTWQNFPEQVLPYLMVFTLVYRVWDWTQLLKISSLDDRAMLEYDKEFEQLAKNEQETILRQYRVGTYVVDHLPDERQMEVKRDAHVRASEIVRLLLPAIAVVYWAGWRFLPEGRLRAGWTDGPVVMVWAGLVVVALPQILQMWSEPDDLGEPKIVSNRASI